MDREIKFRGKRIDTMEWVYGSYVVDADTKKHFICTEWVSYHGWNLHEVIPESVGQFTGMIDMAGDDIYEGDFVKGDTTTTALGKGFKSTRIKKINFEVKWLDTGWVISGKIDYNYRGMPHIEDCKIIGNTTDNPELLEEKK